jgi:hypothetical protein
MAHTCFTHGRVFAAVLFLAASSVQAQNPQQIVRPPKVNLWMDVSTGGMAGMPDMDMQGLGGMMAGMGGMGRGTPGAKSTGREYYGSARGFHMMPPRILDIALWNGLKPGVEAAQRIPAGLRLGEKLPLLPVIPDKVVERKEGPAGPDSPEGPADYETPKGRILFYWGCSPTVRAGQPRIVDLSKMTADAAAAFGSAFSGRFAPDRGAKVTVGYDVFPNERDQRSIPRDASLVGEHQIVGEAVPPSFRFNLGPAHDVMPAIELQSKGTLADSVSLSWTPVTNAKAYFLHAMGAQGDDMIFWSSSEVPDSGFGLFDFLSNATIDKWTKETVLLGANVSQCAVPKGIMAAQGASSRRGGDDSGAMLRMIAYGGEHGFVHPPRPTDPKVPWDQEWSVRLRVKSQTMAMLGEEIENQPKARGGTNRSAERGAAPASSREPAEPSSEQNPGGILSVPNPVNVLKGLFGR